MARSIIVQSRADSRIFLGSDAVKGRETPDTRLTIDVSNYVLLSDREAEGDLQVVQLCLSVPQMAELVRQFFVEIITPKNMYAKLLRRLLQKRWAAMSSPLAKMIWHGQSTPLLPRYFE